MPDFTIVMMAQCRAGLWGRFFDFSGYQQHISFDERTVATCTCPSYKFSTRTPKWCKHLAAAQKQLCNYHEQIDGPPKEVNGEKVCPKCGGPIEYVRVAI